MATFTLPRKFRLRHGKGSSSSNDLKPPPAGSLVKKSASLFDLYTRSSARDSVHDGPFKVPAAPARLASSSSSGRARADPELAGIRRARSQSRLSCSDLSAVDNSSGFHRAIMDGPRKAKAVSTPKVPIFGGPQPGNGQRTPQNGQGVINAAASQQDSGYSYGFESPESSLSTATTSSSNLSSFHPQQQQQHLQQQDLSSSVSPYQRSSFIPSQKAVLACSAVAPGAMTDAAGCSYHSSSSSLASADRSTADSICSIDVNEMIATGVPELEILNMWLTSINLEEYYSCFAAAGYDMQTISRMTPEDLTAVGIQKPNHRKKLRQEISRLNLHDDGTPSFVPASVDEWLHLLRLSHYGDNLKAQGYDSMSKMCQLCVEDLEDVGILKLGHQKRFLVAIKKLKQAIKLRAANAALPPMPMTANNMSRYAQSSQFPMSGLPPSPYRGLDRTSNPNTLSESSGMMPSYPVAAAGAQQQSAQPVYCPEVIPISFHSGGGRHKSANSSPSHQYPSCVVNSGPPQPPPSQQQNCIPSTFTAVLPPQGSAASSTNSNGSSSRASEANSVPGALSSPPTSAVSNSSAIQQQQQQPCHSYFSHSLGRNRDRLSSSSSSANKHIPVAKVAAVTRQLSCEAIPDAEKYAATEVNKPLPDCELKSACSMKGRNTGDVLNDIGSMLADLTDELDSMLHSEPN